MAQTYGTIVARRNMRAISRLSDRAKASARRVQSSEMKTREMYGQAMAGTIAQAYDPAQARGTAGKMTLQSRVAQAKAAAAVSQVSTGVYEAGKAALPIAQDAAMARVTQAAKPSVISAKSALAEADAYVKQIGIDMKKMDWSAKAAIYESIVSQNFEMARMQFASQLELESQQKMFDLQQKMAADAKLEGAPAVVEAVGAPMSQLVVDLQEALKNKQEDGTIKVGDNNLNVADFARQWAASNTVDPAATALLTDIMYKAVMGGAGHIGENGLPDFGWVKGLMRNSITNAYPGYSDYASDIDAALTPKLYGATLNQNMAGGGLSWSGFFGPGGPLSAEQFGLAAELTKYAPMVGGGLI